MSKHIIEIDQSLDQFRIDKATAGYLNVSRTKIQKLIQEGLVLKNGLVCLDASSLLNLNDIIEIEIPDTIEVSNLLPKDIPLNIVYEDNDIIVLNKQAGLTVHPSNTYMDDTLVNALLFRYQTLSTINDNFRPGIVHRLDKDTSGLMIVARNDKAHVHLAEQLQDRSLKRKYKALVWGMPKSQGVVEENIGRSTSDRTKMCIYKNNEGKEAVTYYKVLHIYLNGMISLIECELETGRTHQIRVHMSHIGHSIVGDQVYGHNTRKSNQIIDIGIKNAVKSFQRQALHSYYISFIHPKTEEVMEFEITLPDDISTLITTIDNYRQA